MVPAKAESNMKFENFVPLSNTDPFDMRHLIERNQY